MSEERPRRKKVFTVDEANACLPLVRAIASDMVCVSRDLADRRQRLEVLMRGREVVAGDPYADELSQIRQELEKDASRVADYTRELIALGVELKSPVEGLIDFPSQMDGRFVYLCWKFDEPEVLYWHERGEGFANRQPLTVDMLADDGPDSGTGLLDA